MDPLFPTTEEYGKNLKNFRVRLYRQYPQICEAVEIMVEDYTQTLKQIAQNLLGEREEMPKQEYADRLASTNLEIEARFGKKKERKLGNGDDDDDDDDDNKQNQSHFVNYSISYRTLKEIETMLDTHEDWSGSSGWHLVYDYRVGQRERFRQTYDPEKDGLHVEYTRKIPFRTRDFGYQLVTGDTRREGVIKPRKETTDPNLWELGGPNSVVRVSTNLEVGLTRNKKILEYTHVRASMRRHFTIPCSHVPEVSFRFDLIKFWVGNTLPDVEEQMVDKKIPPTCLLECEILRLPQSDILTEKQKYLIFASLLLKMQDFISVPQLRRYVNRKNLKVPVGTFQPLR